MIGSLALALAQEAYKPYVAPASDEGELAIERMKVPEGFEVKLWAAEPQLANPVAMCIDAKGDVYVAETFRLKQGVDDIRDHMDWLDDDVACRTVEDRLAYLEKHLQAKFAEYSVASERVRWLSDTDGDGRADADRVFAEGFDDASAGIAAGLLAWQGSVYFTCIPALWELRDTDGDHRADERKALSTGYGIRFALIGHDLHGLALGPDGKLYFSCGDRGLSVPLPNGSRLDNQFSGAVLRCNLDGSELELYATGLRNPQELVFDDYGELFTVDNNSDGGDKARLVHVIEGMDAGWRQSYQWLTEPNLRGPWNDEELWKPHFEGQAAYIVPPLANMCEGPSGLTYNPGTALTPEWREHFFVCDFRGDRTTSGIRAFTLKPKGASFELDKNEKFVWGTLATDCEFGPDGNLYWTDWVEGWGKTGKGRVYRLLTLPNDDVEPAGGTSDHLPRITSDSPDLDLIESLSHSDRSVRLAAQLELVSQRRFDELWEVAESSSSRLARLHAIWGCATNDFSGLSTLNEDPDPIIRAAAARGLGITLRRFGDRAIDQIGVLIDLLADPDALVRREAAIAVSKLDDSSLRPAGLQRLRQLLDDAGHTDAALRHAAVMGLTNWCKLEDLLSMAHDPSADVRIGAVVALRRWRDRHVAEFLDDAETRVVVEAARAIYDVPIEAAYPALANLIGDRSATETALVRRVLHANFRLGGEERAAKLARFATRESAEELHRWEALDLLSKWAEPPGRDGLTGEWWPMPKRDASFLPQLVGEMRVAGIERAPARVVTAWIELADRCGAKDEAAHLVKLARDTQRDAEVRVAAIGAVESLEPKQLGPALNELGADAEAGVRAAALHAAPVLSPETALPLFERAAVHGSRDERRVAYAALAKLDGPEVDALFASELDKLRANLIPAEVALDLVLASEQRSAGHVRHALDALREPRSIDAALAPFVDSLYGGDAARGKTLFREDQETTCLKCHKIEWGEGGQVGPDLNGVGERLSRIELLASIADPNRTISRGYEGIVLTLDDDSHVSGIVVAETSERIKLRTAQDELVEVEASAIANRRKDLSSMPQNVASFLSREEMRDLIEYLANLLEED